MDLYTTLGINRSASPDEIKRAYRSKAHEHHPDKNQSDPEAEARFKDVKRAYEILRDTARRKRYDETGDTGSGQQELTIEQDARLQLVLVLMSVVDETYDPRAVDLIHILRERTQECVRKMIIGIGQAEVSLENQQAMRKRLKKKSGEDGSFLLEALDHKIRDTECAITHGNRQVEVGQAMLKMIDEHQYERDDDIFSSVNAVRQQMEQGMFVPMAFFRRGS